MSIPEVRHLCNCTPVQVGVGYSLSTADWREGGMPPDQRCSSLYDPGCSAVWTGCPDVHSPVAGCYVCLLSREIGRDVYRHVCFILAAFFWSRNSNGPRCDAPSRYHNMMPCV
jgi:hypothetical protein